MKVNIVKYYKSVDYFKQYFMTNKKRVKEIKKLYSSNDRYFGKKVLDIGCGGGILGFVIENKAREYIGVDINPDMIKACKEYAKEINSKNKFIKGDVTKKKISGKFDTITCLGNGLCHITTYDFLSIIKNLERNVHKGTHFIVEYRDVVELLFNKKWKDKMIEKKAGKTFIDLTVGYDAKAGEILKEAFTKDNKNKIKFSHTIWSPFIIEPLMESFGWKLVKRSRISRWPGYTEVYKKM